MVLIMWFFRLMFVFRDVLFEFVMLCFLGLLFFVCNMIRCCGFYYYEEFYILYFISYGY